MAQDVTGDDDPVRTYTPEEQSKLTLQLQAITRRVHAGELRSRLLGLDLLRELHEELFRGVRDHGTRSSESFKRPSRAQTASSEWSATKVPRSDSNSRP